MRDVDAAGIMFFARFFSLVHEAYEEMFAEHGVSYKDQIEAHGIIWPIVHAEADYKIPLPVDARVRIRLRVAEIKERTYAVEFEFLNAEGESATRGKIIHACVDYKTRRSTPLPESLLKVLRACS